MLVGTRAVRGRICARARTHPATALTDHLRQRWTKAVQGASVSSSPVVETAHLVTFANSGAVDWREDTAAMITAGGHTSALGPVAAFAHSVYPEADLWPWQESPVPRGFWSDRNQQRLYLDWLGRRLGFSAREDWYKVRAKDFQENYGEGLLKEFKSSPCLVVSSIYSDYTFHPWKFRAVPKGFFDSSENLRTYVDWVKETVGVADDSALRKRHFVENCGGGLLIKYKNSPQLLLAAAKGNLDGNTTADTMRPRDHSPKHYWEHLANQVAFMDGLAQRLGFSAEDRERWYGVSGHTLLRHDGVTLLCRYNGSMPKLLTAVYPDYVWLPWKFTHPPKNLWEDDAVFEQIFLHTQRALNISEREGWQRVTRRQLDDLGVDGIFQKRGGLAAILAHRFPDVATRTTARQAES